MAVNGSISKEHGTNMIKRLFTILALILPLAVFGQNQYVGTFIGNGGGLTNIAGGSGSATNITGAATNQVAAIATNVVTGQGYVTASITNGLANTTTWSGITNLSTVSISFNGVNGNSMDLTNAAICFTNFTGTAGSWRFHCYSNNAVTYSPAAQGYHWLSTAPTTTTNAWICWMAQGTNYVGFYQEQIQ